MSPQKYENKDQMVLESLKQNLEYLKKKGMHNAVAQVMNTIAAESKESSQKEIDEKESHSPGETNARERFLQEDDDKARAEWGIPDTENLQRRFHSLPPPTEPQQWIGRSSAERVVSEVVLQNFHQRLSTNHADFTFLVASGHVRSGKTRTGMETPRIVQNFCEAELTRKNVNTAKPVYLRIDFLNGARFNRQFDSPSRSISEALGARLISAFYEKIALQNGVTHDVALQHIVTHIRNTHPDRNLIVPIVIHFDEHGAFIDDMNKVVSNRGQPGKDYFLGMLQLIGSAATTNEGYLSAYHKMGAYFLVPITTGTSHSAANFDRASRYKIWPVPLPVLTFDESLLLAESCLEVTGLEPDEICTTLNDAMFRIALGDTGGLPGLVFFLSTRKLRDLSYVEHLHNRTKSYIAGNWNHRWAAITSVCLARPRVTNTTVLMTEYKHPTLASVLYGTRDDFLKVHPSLNPDMAAIAYTVQDALDGGTVFWQADGEIGLAPALLSKFNGGEGMFNPILTRQISSSQEWTWQYFESAHLLYLAAIMAALVKERRRFSNITLGTLLRSSSPRESSILSEALQLPAKFDGGKFTRDATQCIPRMNAKKGSQIKVSLDDFETVHLAMEGTPIVDGYLNLRLGAASSSDIATKTLFIQYKHSGLESQSSAVHISHMNHEVNKLAVRLNKHGWPQDRGWIFLWVTNRDVVQDCVPDQRLLWVDKTSLSKHAPLLGTRGLVPLEQLREVDHKE